MQGKNLRLSHSQVGMMLRCPKQWEFRYAKGMKIKPSGPMITGSAFHKVAEVTFKRRMVGGMPVTIEEAGDIYSTDFNRAMSEEEIEWKPGVNPGEMKDDGIILARNYLQTIVPGIFPTMVEHVDQFEMIPGVDMMVVIDTVDSGTNIVDYKVTGKAWSDGQAETEIQHYPYLWYMNWLGGAKQPWEGDTSFEYHVNLLTRAKKKRTKPKKWDPVNDALVMRKNVDSVITEAGFRLYREQVEGVAAMIHAGLFPPRGRAAKNFWCSEGMCGYWEYCKGATYKSFAGINKAAFKTTRLVSFKDA